MFHGRVTKLVVVEHISENVHIDMVVMFLSDIVVVLSFDLRGVDPVDVGLEVEGEYLGQFDELLLSLDPALRAGGFEELEFCGDGVFVDGEPLLFLADEYRYRVFVVEARSGVSSSQSVDLVYRSTHVMRFAGGLSLAAFVVPSSLPLSRLRFFWPASAMVACKERVGALVEAQI
jgi:hypothetical protein